MKDYQIQQGVNSMPKVYLDELEDKGNELINYSKNNISNTINELKNATDNFIWKGPGYQSYISQYKTKMDKLEKINNNLSKIASYLIIAKDGYEDANMDINSMYEDLVDEYEELKHGVQ